MAGSPPQALRQALIGVDLALSDTVFQPLTGGRTNRLWRFSSHGRDLVCKMFAGGSTPLFPNDGRVEADTIAHLDGADLAPEFVTFIQIPGAVALVYHRLDGIVWSGAVDPVAQLLHRLHRVAPLPLRRMAKSPLEILQQGDAMLSQVQNSEADHLLRVRPSPPTCALEQVMLHGDPVPSNIVQNDTSLRLIDWQCPAIGDPTEDMAIFLSPAMQHLFGGRGLTPHEVDTFLKAYADPVRSARYLALAPLYHWRMAAYCLWKTQHGDPEYKAGYALELKRL